MHVVSAAALIGLLLAGCAGPTPAARPGPSARAPVAYPPVWSSVYRPDPKHPHHLVNAEGQHLFILAKTAWHYFNAQDPQLVIEKAQAVGANVLRVALEGKLYFEALGIDAWPWGGSRSAPRWERFDEAYWQRVEERVALAGRAGLGIDLVLYASLKVQEDAAANHEAYWQRILDRLGRHANILTWEIQNEYIGNEAFQERVAAYFRGHDPHHRPIITSNGTRDVPTWPHKPWMGMAITHTCTGSTAAHPLEAWYLAVARNARAYGKPSFNNETGREKRHHNDDPVHRRKQGWLWSAAGGFWTWHSWDGCEGINDPNYSAPGEAFVRPMAEYWRGLEFWRLQPEHAAVRVDSPAVVAAALATVERDLLVIYLATHSSLQEAKGVPLWYRLRDGRYEVTFRDPSTGRVVGAKEVVAAGIGHGQELELPVFTDDLLIELRRREAGGETEMPHSQ